MPSFDIDFEVYCGTCGSGLCMLTDVRRSRLRQELQITVEVCPDCIKTKDDEIKELQCRINELESQIK